MSPTNEQLQAIIAEATEGRAQGMGPWKGYRTDRSIRSEYAGTSAPPSMWIPFEEDWLGAKTPRVRAAWVILQLRKLADRHEQLEHKAELLGLSAELLPVVD